MLSSLKMDWDLALYMPSEKRRWLVLFGLVLHLANQGARVRKTQYAWKPRGDI